ncbi:MAG: autotransporter outer membrane beta-barrel domain-containing protein [Deltaproteobacteria bacterium]|nr:autotransporter outer membrane beta-barrel domain-containing protein [Deltaproteobacteria bacterium]
MAIAGGIYGAAISEASTASNTFTNNSVIVSNGVINGYSGDLPDEIFGAHGYSGTATLNTVKITPSGSFTVDGNVAGAVMRGTASASKNAAEIGGTASAFVTLNGSLVGAFVGGTGGSADSNTATLTGHAVITGFVAGANIANGNANKNEAVINGGTGTQITVETSGVYGAMVSGSGTAGNATGNIVTITNAIIYQTGTTNPAPVYGGHVAGDANSARSATGNIVGITKSNVGAVYGGYVEGGTSATGNASSNSVSFDASTLNGDVYGGYVLAGTGKAQNNSVTISGLTALMNSPDVFGGFTTSGTKADYTAGNKLHFNQFSYDSTNNTFDHIGNFSEINFTISASQAADKSVAVVKTANLDLDAGTADTVVKTVNLAGGRYLGMGDEFTLIESASAITYNSASQATYRATGENFTTEYGYEITPGANAITSKVTDINFKQQTVSVSELPLADVVFVNRGSDDIADDAIPSATTAAMGANGFAAFAAIAYGKSRIATGSHIEVKGLTGNVGMAVGTETSAGIATAGIFLEFGRGEFDSFNDFANVPTVHGNGDVTYLGGGLLGRFEIGSQDSSRPYVEASARLGRTKSDFNSRDFTFGNGANVNFELHSRYYGFHAGLGYILNFLDFSQDGSMDISAKIFHTRRDGDDFIVAGDRATISAVTSTRLRVGARVNIGLTEYVKPFVGGYFEREFKGESQATVGPYVLPMVSLEGNTGIGELGVSVTSASMPLEFQVGVEGTGGKRDSITGSMKLNYSF